MKAVGSDYIVLKAHGYRAQINTSCKVIPQNQKNSPRKFCITFIV